MQSTNTNQLTENNPQAIIVTGKMGHGKSSFIRMLVSDEDKKKIQCGSSTVSITNACYSYQMSNQTKKLLNIDQKDHILLIDTPGLDSLNKNYLLIQQIKLIIYQQKCDIIGIIYIRSLSDVRQFDQENKSSLVQFHKIFPVKKQIKNKISLFVMTHIDNEYKRKKGLEKKRESIIQLFTQQNIDFIANRRVEWASQSYEDQGVLKQEIQSNKELKEIFKKQWIQLGKLINESRQIKYSNIQFNNQNSLYEQAYCTRIKKLAQTLEEKRKTIVPYQFQTPEITTQQKIQKIGGLLKKLPILLPGSMLPGAVAAGTAATVTTLSLSLFAIALPLSVALGFFLIQKQRQKNWETIKQQLMKEKKEDIQKQELFEMAKKSVEILFLKQMIHQTYVKANQIQFPPKQWCRKIEIKQIIQGEQIFLKKYEQKNGFFGGLFSFNNDSKLYWKFEIKASCSYAVQMTFQIPTETQILKVMKSVAKQVYYDQFENNEN